VLTAILLAITESAYARVELLEDIKHLLEEATGEKIEEERKLIDAIKGRLSHIKSSLNIQNLSDEIVKGISNTENPKQLLMNAWKIMQTGNLPTRGIEAQLTTESGNATQISVGLTEGHSVSAGTEGQPRAKITIYHSRHITDDEREGLKKIASLLAKVSSEMWGRMTDPLTGLWTRDILKTLQSCSRCAAIIIDVDNFKQINDTRGHLYGDKILQKLSRCIRSATRKDDISIRYGGDEFIIIVNSVPLHVAENIARRIIRCATMGGFSVSIGVGYCDREMAVESLVHLADQALYEAKEKKNTMRVKRC
jgi:diguanylate cyclase (GGDEF)-like protein